MLINEIFLGIQGEGLYQNEPMAFIRFQGCNLLLSKCCLYCDTVYAQDSTKGKEISIEEVVEKVSSIYPVYKGWVCITGGEPLWQESELYNLIMKLKEGGYRLTVETNGSIQPPRWYTLVDSWNADIKGPSSGVCGVSKESWFKTRGTDQIKFVVSTDEDLVFAKSIMGKHRTDSPVIEISPIMDFKITNNKLVISNLDFLRKVWNFTLDNRLRLSIQQHKLVWGSKKGV